MRTLWRTKIAGIFIALLLVISGCSSNSVPTTAPLTKVEESKQTQTPEQQDATTAKDNAPNSVAPDTSPEVIVAPAPTLVVEPSPAPSAPPVVAPTPTPAAPPAATPSPAPEQTPQEVAVFVTKTSAKYHRGGCRYLSKSKIPISLSDAKSGYGPCSVCNPPQ